MKKQSIITFMFFIITITGIVTLLFQVYRLHIAIIILIIGILGMTINQIKE